MENAAIQKLFYENRTIIEKEIKMCILGLRNSDLFCFWDINEIAQELRIKAYESLRYYNPKRAKVKTYLKKVLERKVIDLLRRQKSKIRNGNISLEYIFENIELGNAKKLSEFFIAYTESDVGISDVYSIINKLSPDLQNVCKLLSESYNVSEIAKILKRSRTTIHKQIKELRNALKDFR